MNIFWIARWIRIYSHAELENLVSNIMWRLRKSEQELAKFWIASQDILWLKRRSRALYFLLFQENYYLGINYNHVWAT